MKKFNCLEGQSATQTQISDHEPVIIGSVCVWNLMCRGTAKNNHFKLVENVEDYRKRLKKIILAIKELKDSGVDVFMFQEAPQYSGADDPNNVFYNELKKITGFEKLDTSNINTTDKTRSALFTIADYKRFPQQVNKTSSSNITIKGRFQTLQLTSANSTQISLLNIHGDWTQQQDTRDTLKECLMDTDPWIIGGDFNITSDKNDINLFNKNGIYQKTDFFQTCDGLLGTESVADLVPIKKHPISDNNKKTNNSKPTYVKREENTFASVQEMKQQFFKMHKQYLTRDKSVFFLGLFRRTNVKYSMTLEEIIKHAQKYTNRSRQICIKLGWMDKNGMPSKRIKEMIRLERQAVKEHSGIHLK